MVIPFYGTTTDTRLDLNVSQTRTHDIICGDSYIRNWFSRYQYSKSNHSYRSWVAFNFTFINLPKQPKIEVEILITKDLLTKRPTFLHKMFGKNDLFPNFYSHILLISLNFQLMMLIDKFRAGMSFKLQRLRNELHLKYWYPDSPQMRIIHNSVI